MTERDEPYTPNLADGQSYYVAGRAQLRRLAEAHGEVVPDGHDAC